MIYLYAGLGMAMLLPILVGLQSAVNVAELEQGELAMQNLNSKFLKDWEERQLSKKDFIEAQISNFPSNSPASGECVAVAGYVKTPDCTYHSTEKHLTDYFAKIYNKNGTWKGCIVRLDSDVCPGES